MAEAIVDEMDTEFNAVNFYSDSRVVLGYIHNTVQCIRGSTSSEQWKYVATNENPADHGSKSVPAGSLTHITWLSGPAFLLLSDEHETPPTSFDLVEVKS